MPRLPIEHGDTGAEAREKINDSRNELLENVQNFRPLQYEDENSEHSRGGHFGYH